MIGRLSDAPIWTANPIDWDCPLNRGLSGWWHAIPGLDAGGRIYDLCGLRHGTISAGLIWRPSQRTDGAGYLACNATNDFATLPTLSWLNGAPAYTYALWMCQSNTGKWSWFNAHGTTERIGALTYVTQQLYNYVGSANYAILSPTLTAPFHLAVAFDGTQSGNANRLKIYINGSAQAPSYGGTIPATAPAVTPTVHYLYQRVAGGYEIAATIEDYRIWNRALPASDVAAVYDDARRGCQATLRRLPQRVFSYGATAFPGAYFRVLQNHGGQ